MNMMRKILIGLMLCVNGIAYSQTDSTETIMKNQEFDFYKNSVGFELRKFAEKQKLSMGLQLMGAVVVGVGAYDGSRPLTCVGGGMLLIGIGIHVASYTHLENASILLDERGVGLAIKIK
jgi:hypothetical protein